MAEGPLRGPSSLIRALQVIGSVGPTIEGATGMPRRKDPVVGHFAFMSPMEVVCTDVNACVVAGSRTAMEQYLAEAHPHRAADTTVKKTRFSEILRGLKLGAGYAFDEESYRTFYPLARRAGLPVEAGDFAPGREQGGRFFTVRLVTT